MGEEDKAVTIMWEKNLLWMMTDTHSVFVHDALVACKIVVNACHKCCE